jgi:Fur family peroxide stress response transcriptional regulator
LVKIDRNEINRRMDRFTEVCRESGAKLTPQRMEIFREVAQSGDHPDAESVYRGVRRRMPTVSLDTVYRTLWWLKGLNLVNTLGPTRERTRFDANLESHHHFVCRKCERTQDFFSERLNQMDMAEMVPPIGRIETIQVEVTGVCRECTANPAVVP